MTTASIYYHPRNGEPDYILIDGERADVVAATATALGGYRLTDVDAACRRLGWKIMPGAWIVRQADGRGTVRIEPLSGPDRIGPGHAYIRATPGEDGVKLHIDGQGVDLDAFLLASKGLWEATDKALTDLGYKRTSPITTTGYTAATGAFTASCTASPADATVHDPAPTVGTAYISSTPGGVPTVVRVHDGRTLAVMTDTLTSLSSPHPTTRGLAVTAVDAALREMGYRRSGDIVVDDNPDAQNDPQWKCAVVKAAATVRYEDWRDVPTLVRVGDTAAALLTNLSAELGIPRDELADAWIRRAARNAHDEYIRWLEPGYIEDHARIKGWDATGFPYLDELPAARRKDT